MRSRWLALCAVAGVLGALSFPVSADGAWNDGWCQEGEGQAVVVDEGNSTTIRCIVIESEGTYPEDVYPWQAAVLASAGIPYEDQGGLITSINGVSGAPGSGEYWHFTVGDPASAQWDVGWQSIAEIDTVVGIRLSASQEAPRQQPQFAPGDPSDGPTTPGDGPSTPGDGPSTPGDGPTTPGDGPSTPGDGPSTPDDGPSTPDEDLSQPPDRPSTPADQPSDEPPTLEDDPPVSSAPPQPSAPDQTSPPQTPQPSASPTATASPTPTAAPSSQAAPPAPASSPSPVWGRENSLREPPAGGTGAEASSAPLLTWLGGVVLLGGLGGAFVASLRGDRGPGQELE